MKKFFEFLKNYDNAFIVSIVLGYAIWLGFYLIIPIQTQELSLETKSFIGCSILSLALGYFSINKNSISGNKSKQINYFLIIAVLAALGLIFRYFDLFYFRQLSFNNNFYTNKQLSIDMVPNSNLLILLLAALRILSPIPILYLILNKSKSKVYWLIAIIIIAISTIEIFLFGTRKPIFHLLVLMLLAFIYSYRYKIKLNLKFFIITFVSLFSLAIFSYVILNRRLNEKQQTNNKLIDVVNSRYNDFVKIQDYKIEEFEKHPNSFFTNAQILFIHTGQYVVHGFYELDYIVKNNLPHAKGVYSFKPIFKLTNRLNITNTNLNTDSSHPRRFVYTSFFGSFFIDFGWFALIPMFLFGAFQKIIFHFSQQNTITKVFFIFLLSVNISMPIFNILSGSGIYLFLLLTMFSIPHFLKKSN